MSLSSDSIQKETGTYSLSQPCSRVEVFGDDNQYVMLGGQKYLRSELQHAFGGTFQAERYSTGPTHNFGNPAPVGLAGFGLTAVTLGLYYAGAKGIHEHQMIVGCLVFDAGLLLFVGGIWEMCIGNTFGATAFLSYGTFWFSFATISLPAFGIAKGYGDDHAQLANANGLFLCGWTIFTFMMWSFTWKSTWAFFSMFTCLLTTFCTLTAAAFTGSEAVAKAGGVLAVITGFLGWACGFAGVATPENSYFNLPTRPMPLITTKGIKYQYP
ncbi:hypothetical protein DIURU_000308 [Diutina rugosa]|uniref:Uncharacterized protein n=1 Tax=Diutina rugosa TaxID=5481 RepID=A0A642UYC1_DIURU|nr:uncharacterized protein DIURU_000308 [Diutina rugosa]KAA8907898.1 hypothetical protein DIURU_000308 [Diutina rugosa]